MVPTSNLQAVQDMARPDPIQLTMYAFDRGHVLGGAGEMYFEVQADFNGVTVCRSEFRSINALQSHIVEIRQAGTGNGTRRLSCEEELLMRGPSTKSNEPTHLAFVLPLPLQFSTCLRSRVSNFSCT